MQLLVPKIKLLLQNIKSSEAIQQSVILTIGTTITGLIMGVAMIIASRILGPEKFGIFSVSVSLSFILSKGADLGLHQLVPKLFNKWITQPNKRNDFLAQLIKWKLYMSLGTLIVGLFLIPFLSRVLNYPHLGMIVWAVLGGIIISLYEYYYVILSGFHKFIWVAGLSMAQAFMKLLGFLSLLIFASQSAYGIAGFYYLAPLVVCVLSFYWLKKYVYLKPKTASKEVRSEMTVFLKHTLVGVIAMTLIANLDVLMVQRYLNPFETGVYGGILRIAAFITFASSAVGGVLSNRVSRYHDLSLRRSYLKKSLLIVLLSLAGFIAFLPFARLSISLTIGPEYMSGLSALILLVFNAFLSLAIVPYTAFFYSVDHPRYFSVSGILQVLVIFFGNYFFLPVYGLYAAAVVRTVATGLFGIFTVLYILYALDTLKTNATET